MRWNKDSLYITDDPDAVDVAGVHRLLADTYWARERPRERTEASLAHSLCFSVKTNHDELAGFARVISDGGCYSIISDVVIDPKFRKRGIGKWLIGVICQHPQVVGSVIILWTTDQVEFYKHCGLVHESGIEVMRKPPPWMKSYPGMQT